MKAAELTDQMSRRPPRPAAFLAVLAILLAVAGASWVRPAAAHAMPCCASGGHCDVPALGEACCPSGQAPALPAGPTFTTAGKQEDHASQAIAWRTPAVLDASGGLSSVAFRQGRVHPPHDPPYLLNLSLRI